jgi:hypothetical protein
MRPEVSAVGIEGVLWSGFGVDRLTTLPTLLSVATVVVDGW